MRVKRVEKFRKKRHKKIRNIFILSLVAPSLCILIGYLLTSLIILPAMAK